MAGVTWFGLFLVIGATARLTRLVAKDKIAIRVRIAAANRDARRRAIMRPALRLPAVPGQTPSPSAPPSPTFEFVTCPWCVSVWIGAAASALYLIAPHGAALSWVQWLYAALTASHATAYLITREPS